MIAVEDFWLIVGAQSRFQAIDTMKNGALPGASEIWRGMIGKAIEKNIVEYMTGRKTVEQTLSDIEADYITTAKEAGLL